MSKENNVYLHDILESIEKIEAYTENLAYDGFSKNTEAQDAVMRRLMIIGEAVKQISQEFKNRHTEIAWKQIAGMRDVLIHEYAGVLLERVWKVVKDDLPVLKERIVIIQGE